MNMNCKEYMQAITADPSESFDGGAVHVASCESCSAFRDEIRALDDKIVAALSIAVPELKLPELPPVTADSNVVELPRPRGRRLSTPQWIGLAASVAIAAVIGSRFIADEPVYDSLADEVLAHLDHERNSLRVTSDPVSEQTLDRVVRSDVASMNKEIGLVTYARTCVINGRKIPHLVIQGEHGPVTLLLMPEEEIDSAIVVNGEGVSGVILPLGKGSIAIIGERGENIEAIEKRVIDSVEWKI